MDTGEPCTTDSSGSNCSDNMMAASEARLSPVHFVLPMLTPKTPGSRGDFSQLRNYTHNQIILNRALTEEKHKVILCTSVYIHACMHNNMLLYMVYPNRYTTYVVYLAVALIWRFGESHKYRQMKCTPFRLQAWVSFHTVLKTAN